MSYTRVLVPMKLGPIGEEMVATAVALAKERGASVDAVFVIQVPLEYALDAPLHDLEERAASSLAEAVLLGEENGVQRRARERARPVDRPRDRRAGNRARRRRDRARLVATVAPAVGLLLADGRLRAPARAVRGSRRRLSPGCARRRTLRP